MDFLRCGYAESDHVCWNGMEWNGIILAFRHNGDVSLEN